MSSFLCFVCHSTVNADTNEDTRDKYREVIGMNLCPDSHLCFICCHVLNKMWLFKSICLKRSLEYPVLFSEKGTINLQRSDTQVGILCPEDMCLQHWNSTYHFYNNNEDLPPDVEENSYLQLHEEMHFGLLPNNVEVQTDDIFDHFNVNLLKSDAGDDQFNNEFLVSISKENNEVNTRKDIDEFIFGNDSIESPLDNINKIELANLEEMSEVNITLTDLNVRNFEKLHNYERNDIVAKTYYRNEFGRQEYNIRNGFVEKSQELVRNNNYIEKPRPDCSVINNDYVEKSTPDCNDRNNDYIEKSRPDCSVINNDYVEKSTPDCNDRNNDYIEKSRPDCSVINNGYVEKSRSDFSVINNDYVEKPRSDCSVINNDYVEKPRTDCSVINNDYVQKSGPNCIVRNNDYIDKSQEYYGNNFEKTQINVLTNDILEKSEEVRIRYDINKTPELVRNIGFIEKSQEYVVRSNDFVESPETDNEFDKHNDSNQTIDSPTATEREDVELSDTQSNKSQEFEESLDNVNNTDLNKKNKKKSKSNTNKSKSLYNKINLTIEQQKLDLEANRKDKKYTDAEFKCFSCAVGFVYKDTYQAHMMRHEESNGEHRCSVCTLRFASAALLRAHRSNHAVRYQCIHCEDIVKRRHRQSHRCRARAIVRVACHLCGKVFPGPNHYQQHLKRAHRESSGRTYLCNVCGQSYDNQAAVRTHMITHINRKFTCDICSSTFSSPYTLNQHRKKHDSPTTQHYCMSCNIGYNTRKSLLAHLRNALVHKERVYKCPVCDKTCPNLRSLQNHTISVHVRTKDMFCALCPARYSTKKGLVRHMKIHNNTGPRQLPLCHSCGQTFKSSSILKRHLKNVCEKDKLEEELSNYYEQ